MQLLLAVNLVEHATVGEVFFLRLGPAAENFVDGDQVQLLKLIRIFLGHLGIAWAIVVLGGNFLTFGRV